MYKIEKLCGNITKKKKGKYKLPPVTAAVEVANIRLAGDGNHGLLVVVSILCVSRIRRRV